MGSPLTLPTLTHASHVDAAGNLEASVVDVSQDAACIGGRPFGGDGAVVDGVGNLVVCSVGIAYDAANGVGAGIVELAAIRAPAYRRSGKQGACYASDVLGLGVCLRSCDVECGVYVGDGCGRGISHGAVFAISFGNGEGAVDAEVLDGRSRRVAEES